MYNDKSKSKRRDSCKLWLCLGCSKNWGQKWWLESVGTLSIYLGWWSHHTLEHDNVIHEHIHWMSLSVPEQMAWTSNNIDNSEGFINQSAVENDSWKSTKLENKQWFVLFVCMTRRMKCIELTLLSCLIARAFHVIGVICYIACHFIGATGQRHETLLLGRSNGDGSANKSTVYRLMSE